MSMDVIINKNRASEVNQSSKNFFDQNDIKNDSNNIQNNTIINDSDNMSQHSSNSTFAINPSDTDNNEDHFIKCIFLCKFHAIAGPQIAAQVPNNYIPKDVFDTISQYVIPKAQLQRSFVSV